jgi:hypothetical protein
MSGQRGINYIRADLHFFADTIPVTVHSTPIQCTVTVNSMLRGSRFIILAIAGLALIAAAKPPEQQRATEKPEGPAEISDSLKSIAATLGSIAKANEAKHPCGPKEYQSNDDLCAQWKAADAAGDAAEWGWWQMVLSGFGVLIGAVTMFAAIKAALFARDAARETKRAADIAWDIGIAQTGAMVVVDSASGFQVFPVTEPLNTSCNLKNVGETNAMNVMPYGILVLGDPDKPIARISLKAVGKRSGVIGRHQAPLFHLKPRISGSQASLFAQFDDKKTWPGRLLVGIRYADAYGNIWRQNTIVFVRFFKEQVLHYDCIKFECDVFDTLPARKLIRKGRAH